MDSMAVMSAPMQPPAELDPTLECPLCGAVVACDDGSGELVLTPAGQRLLETLAMPLAANDA